ncbi:NAD(P)-dependent dehydrogenase (short-subunit alcohol dehydrogenase family) [Nocardioides albertanoniae]|uniref:NAD(P)-dependent dehydrogenase (Short-subunit alcohol dehydrogenase family) n=1 Tax=Nocardioides albertanoniae TaxID=1175486 RepID=A0A543A5N8_9ACTN|nr:SDR family oxidoreductase [Nocardioides albertanoniae]TQL67913.1 NAD(P)-dependent dehydrogenase (short-subunit alcohol dehydrogenase family) [Nocardioides albertanoniae]
MSEANRHVVVIGGTQGLGLEIARSVVGRGDRATVAGRHADVAEQAAKELGDLAAYAVCDLTDWSSLERFFESMGPIDHLVLAALDRDNNDIREFRPDDSQRTSVMKNVGYATAVHYALPKLTPEGSVLMFSGLSMWRPFPGSTTISMANAGVVGLANSLAVQIAPVRVNVITPGVVAGTQAVDNADQVRADAYEVARQRTPGKRLPHTQDIVDASLALLDNPGINGANLVVDAGMHLI